ncbi:family 2A encapsulin nanocompartment cargo protein cysteine desulfurase [Undibacterium sp. SXout7W]|uniref:family 2A encapsulin nanocompartment cargo protein cysteine desulfurase n=1 Tax=Undibacterium sp. SXout7W TaxID=3413049 RepID=UPI003BF4577B
MTILTPTNNSNNAASAGSGLLDEGILNRMAAEFFSHIPGSAQGVSGLLPGLSHLHENGTSISSGASSSPVAGVPQIAPVQGSGNHTSLATPSAQSANAQGVPVAYAAALPQISRASASSITGRSAGSSYYFLDQSDAPDSSSALDQLATQATGNPQQVEARSFGLPGQDQLQQLLSELYPARSTVPTESGVSQSKSGFYFQQGEQTYWDAAPRSNNPGASAQAPFDINIVRRDFPILAERVNGKSLVWFDNAATTQKPQSVIDRIAYFYQHENSNIHRAAHELAARATDAYESARNKVTRFLGAASPDEIIFVRGATEAINLVANTFGKKFIGAGDEIIVSHLEHHANIVPWQQLAAEKGAVIRVIPVDDSGQIILDEYRKLLNSRTRLVSVTQVSNALGTITPVQEIIALAHAAGARVLIDGAQAVSHLKVNVQALDADFYVFSGHKIFGPTGIGVVYGKKALLEELPPWQGGGNMIADVTFERTQYQPAPARFEAGTGNIADAVGLGAAIDYVERIGLDKIALYEHALLEYATHGLKSIPGVRLIGTAHQKASVASFVLAGYRTEEVGKALNDEGIAVRSGHHCAQPILRRFGVEATVRPSFAFYNTCEEIDRMIAVVRRLANIRPS